MSKRKIDICRGDLEVMQIICPVTELALRELTPPGKTFNEFRWHTFHADIEFCKSPHRIKASFRVVVGIVAIPGVKHPLKVVGNFLYEGRATVDFEVFDPNRLLVAGCHKVNSMLVCIGIETSISTIRVVHPSA